MNKLYSALAIILVALIISASAYVVYEQMGATAESSPSPEPSLSPAPIVTSTPTAIPSPTLTLSPTLTPSPSPTLSLTPTPSPTLTPSPSPTATPAPVITGSVLVYDFTGNLVNITVPVHRAIVLEPYALTYIYGLNAGSAVVGRGGSNSSVFPPVALDIPYVGTNAELALQYNPDIIIGEPKDAALTAYQAAGIPIFQLYVTPLVTDLNNNASYMLSGAKLANTFGILFGKEQRATEISNYITYYANIISSRVANLTRANEPLVLWEAFPPYETLCNSYIRQTGGINIAENQTFYYPTLSAEFVVQENPDIIIDFISSTNHTQSDFIAQQQSVYTRPELATCTAVVKHQVYIMDWAAEGGGGNMLDIVGYIQWAKWIQPALFADMNPSAVQTDMCNQFFNGTQRTGVWWYPS
jgi:iron complex transport system substrate-binding protein